MTRQHSIDRLLFVASLAAFAVLHLSVEMLNGGVRTHYPLMRDDLPAISNWWGLLVLPALAWILYPRIDKSDTTAGILGLRPAAIWRLFAALAYGAALSAAFEFGLGQTPLYLLFGLLIGGLFYPLFRAELILGFILGMTYTFGAVIPSVVISLVACWSWVAFSSLQFIVRTLRRQITS